MKKLIIIISLTTVFAGAHAQAPTNDQIAKLVVRLDQASTPLQYQTLAGEFLQYARHAKNEWLPWYYAAFCHAKLGWLNQENPDAIEPFADQAEEEAAKARGLLD